MTTSTIRRASAALTALVGIGSGVAAALGVFARGDGEFVTATTPRGETVDVATTGVYAHSARQLVVEGVGWDVFTLLVAAPLLLVGAALVARGSFRGTLVAAGMLAYALYLYLEYAVGWAFGPLFPLFITLTALSVLALIGVGSLVAAAGVAGRFSEGFPRRGWAALSIGMGLMLIALWGARIAEGLAADVPALHGGTTMAVQALDLGLLVPMLLLLPVLAWRRVPGAMAASIAFGVMFAALGAAIVSMMVSSWIGTGVAALPPIVVFGLASVASLVLVARMMRSVVEPAASRADGAPDVRPAVGPAGAPAVEPSH